MENTCIYKIFVAHWGAEGEKGRETEFYETLNDPQPDRYSKDSPASPEGGVYLKVSHLKHTETYVGLGDFKGRRRSCSSHSFPGNVSSHPAFKREQDFVSIFLKNT